MDSRNNKNERSKRAEKRDAEWEKKNQADERSKRAENLSRKRKIQEEQEKTKKLQAKIQEKQEETKKREAILQKKHAEEDRGFVLEGRKVSLARNCPHKGQSHRGINFPSSETEQGNEDFEQDNEDFEQDDTLTVVAEKPTPDDDRSDNSEQVAHSGEGAVAENNNTFDIDRAHGGVLDIVNSVFGMHRALLKMNEALTKERDDAIKQNDVLSKENEALTKANETLTKERDDAVNKQNEALKAKMC